MRPLNSGIAGPLRGKTDLPGDKSISHRALMIGAAAVGETTISNLLEGEDVLHTAAALRALGAEIARDEDEPGLWHVHGRGVGGLAEPAQVLDLGNSGTGARLIIGLLATHPFVSCLTGDASLTARPMGRVAEPLERMGARIVARSECRLPLAVVGTSDPVPIEYRLPVASAQVKSAILLAALNTPGRSTVIEPVGTRDHTELMLRHFGADLAVAELEDGARAITLTGQPEIEGRTVRVPGDLSSAAFPAVAALVIPGSEITLAGVGVNPLRAGLIETLGEMGADITIANRREEAGEPVADITLRTSALRGVEVPAERAPRMIDEYPILAVAAAFAKGTTTMGGLAELRIKETDRLGATARGLAASGVEVERSEDALVVHGTGGAPEGGAAIETGYDHRIAMAFLVLGMAAKKPVRIDDGAVIDTSFPGFVELMNRLGGSIVAEGEAP